jgi:hypothetical protein
MQRGWCDRNVVREVPKRRERDVAELIVFTPHQVEVLARESTDATIAALIRVAAGTGLRKGELLELRWRDIRLSQRSIRVERSDAAGFAGDPNKGVTTPGSDAAEPSLWPATSPTSSLGCASGSTSSEPTIWCSARPLVSTSTPGPRALATRPRVTPRWTRTTRCPHSPSMACATPSARTSPPPASTSTSSASSAGPATATSRPPSATCITPIGPTTPTGSPTRWPPP